MKKISITKERKGKKKEQQQHNIALILLSKQTTSLSLSLSPPTCLYEARDEVRTKEIPLCKGLAQERLVVLHA
jgi:hypothetical protein